MCVRLFWVESQLNANATNSNCINHVQSKLIISLITKLVRPSPVPQSARAYTDPHSWPQISSGPDISDA